VHFECNRCGGSDIALDGDPAPRHVCPPKPGKTRKASRTRLKQRSG
jgi:hypothetical protein